MSILTQSFIESCQKYSDRTALIEYSSGKELTYTDIWIYIQTICHRLNTMGVQSGEVLCFSAENSLDLVLMLLASFCYGAIACPLNPRLSTNEFENIINHSGAKWIFTHKIEEIPESFADRGIHFFSLLSSNPSSWVPPQTEDLNIALLIYTSGTTGQPKGVPLTHQNIFSNANAAKEWFEYTDHHTSLCILPLFHTFGLISDVLPLLLAGGKTIISPIFDIKLLADIELAIQKYNIHSFSAVPLMFDLMLQFDIKLENSLKFVISGAAPLSISTQERFAEKFGFQIIPAYGLSEATCFVTSCPKDMFPRKSCGKPVHCNLLIVSETSEEVLDCDQVGEILVSGSNVINDTYFENNLSCQSTIHASYIKTGDLGYLDQQGFLYIVGRKKNMLIRGGEKIYLSDIEHTLRLHPHISDCAVIRVNEENQELMIVCIVWKNEDIADSAKSIKSFLLPIVGKQKLPDRVCVVPFIPRTATHKVKMAVLTEMIQEHICVS